MIVCIYISELQRKVSWNDRHVWQLLKQRHKCRYPKDMSTGVESNSCQMENRLDNICLCIKRNFERRTKFPCKKNKTMTVLHELTKYLEKFSPK